MLLFKTHDDFHYYHFPYSYYLTQNSLLVGVGQFNHGFRTPSSIFYLNSLFFLPLAKYYLFYIPTLLIMGFSNQILISRIFKYFKSKKIDFIFFLSLFFFIFINIFFYRLQEHGTDRSAQILILILFLQLLIFLNFDKNAKNELDQMIVILGLIISLKAFYILYLLVPLVVSWILYKENKLNLFKDLLKNKIFYFFLILIFVVLITNFLNTGCLIYPLNLTCFENFSWSLNSAEISKMNQHYNLWSKAGHTPTFKVDNAEVHLQNFNWVSNWIDDYFFNKVSDLIFGLLFTSVFLFLFFFNKKTKQIYYNKNYNFLIILIFFLLVEWFVNHPALRYGGYALFAILFLMPTSIIIAKFRNNFNQIYKKTSLLLCIVVIVFLSRNYVRINDEFKKYNYSPLENPLYKVEKKHFRVEKKFFELISNFEKCEQSLNSCNYKNSLKVKKFLKNRYIFVVKHD
ncbi:hypothetical protein IDH15_00110 [Pelagibacterales bacterium SAG-MED38]|nr:hypothetical protein [Pelagibacterales bacterium SAG-MED38]